MSQGAFFNASEVTLGDSLVSAARSRSHEILISFLVELQSARDSVNEAATRIAAGGPGSFDPLLDSWFRAYRPVEWYESHLGDAIANAVTEPFSQYLKPGSTLRAREFFRPAALSGLRTAVLNVLFDPAPFVSMLANFYGKHRKTRNSIMHGVYQPKLPESKACVTDAIAIYNLVDNKLNHMHPTQLEPPDFS